MFITLTMSLQLFCMVLRSTFWSNSHPPHCFCLTVVISTNVIVTYIDTTRNWFFISYLRILNNTPICFMHWFTLLKHCHLPWHSYSVYHIALSLVRSGFWCARSLKAAIKTSCARDLKCMTQLFCFMYTSFPLSSITSADCSYILLFEK